MSRNEYLNEASSRSSEVTCLENVRSSLDRNTVLGDHEQLCSTDAGHPRFTRKQKTAEKCQMCHCPTCDEYIPDTRSDLDKHFNETHDDYAKCQYCLKKVYLFRKKGGDYYHHQCKHDEPSIYSSSSSISEPCPSTSTVFSTQSGEPEDESLNISENSAKESVEPVSQISLSVPVSDVKSMPS